MNDFNTVYKVCKITNEIQPIEIYRETSRSVYYHSFDRHKISVSERKETVKHKIFDDYEQAKSFAIDRLQKELTEAARRHCYILDKLEKLYNETN